MLYDILNLCRERGSNPHAPFGARDFKRIFLSDYLISISFLTQGWTLLPVIKKINFSGSLYTFIGLPMLGSPSVLFIYGSNTSAEFIQFFFNECFHSRRDSTIYIVSPSCLPIPTSRHNLLYFQRTYIINIEHLMFNFTCFVDPKGIEPSTISLQGSSASLGTCKPKNTHLTFNITFTTNYRMSPRVLVNHFSER